MQEISNFTTLDSACTCLAVNPYILGSVVTIGKPFSLWRVMQYTKSWERRGVGLGWGDRGLGEAAAQHLTSGMDQ